MSFVNFIFSSEKNFANQVIQVAEELKRTSLRFNLDNVNFFQFKSKRWIFRFRVQ